MKIIPYEIREGKIKIAVLLIGDKKIKVPITATYTDDLSVLEKVDWTKLKEEIGEFKTKFIKHLVKLIESNKKEKTILNALYNDKQTEFSVNRILGILKLSTKSKSELSVLLRRLKYANIIQVIEHGRTVTYQLTEFGLEVCDKLFGEEQTFDFNNKSLEEAIK